MVPQYMIDMSKIFGDIEVFQNLLQKRSSLMTPSFILMMSSTKWFLAKKLYTSHVSKSITSLIVIISHFTQAFLLAHNALERITKTKSHKISQF